MILVRRTLMIAAVLVGCGPVVESDTPQGAASTIGEDEGNTERPDATSTSEGPGPAGRASTSGPAGETSSGTAGTAGTVEPEPEPEPEPEWEHSGQYEPSYDIDPEEREDPTAHWGLNPDPDEEWRHAGQYVSDLEQPYSGPGDQISTEGQASSDPKAGYGIHAFLERYPPKQYAGWYIIGFVLFVSYCSR